MAQPNSARLRREAQRYGPDGTLKWSHASEGIFDTSAAAVGSDGTVYAGSTDGNIYAYAEDGTLKWQYTIQGAAGSGTSGNSVTCSTALSASGVIYTHGSDGELYVQMCISRGAGEEVEFASTLESEEARERVSLLDCRQPRNDQFVRMCSWCQRVHANSRWMPVEAAIIELGLMSSPTLPAVTHGICEDCYSKMKAEMSTLRLAS